MQAQMKQRVKWRVIVATAVLAISGTSLAREGAGQTAEGAQRFLNAIAQQYAVIAYAGYNYSRYSLDVSYRMTGAVETASCQTRIEGSVNQYVGVDALGNFSSEQGTFDNGNFTNLPRLQAALELLKVKPLPYVVDWSRVASVQQTNQVKASTTEYGPMPAKQAVLLTTSDATFAFLLPTEELATRTAFAMEFLRLKCDKTGDTGF